MKRILIVCLLGMGMLLPQHQIAAKEFFTKRIVDVYTEGVYLRVTSDSQTGGITLVRIYDDQSEKVAQQNCDGGYQCNVYIGGLHSGEYSVQVTTTVGVYWDSFSI